MSLVCERVGTMPTPDLNLLYTLDAVLSEGSVVRAAARTRLSPSAMSRALARLRETTGDPLLVRAGRGLVATPRALELRDRVRQLVQDAEAALRPAATPDLTRVDRTIVIRSSEGFVESFGPRLMARLRKEAPLVRLRFVPKVTKDSAGLRDGSVDVETGVAGQATSPELMRMTLFRDRFVGAVRKRHPLSRGRITPARYASVPHVAVSRRGIANGPVDRALEPLGLVRQIAIVVGGYSSALALARVTDLIATVPERHTAGLRDRMHSFPLPFATAAIPVSMLWHPRMHADPVHEWFRRCVQEVCAVATH